MRDGKTKTTTYDIAISWRGFNVAAGVSHTFGLTFQVNDTHPNIKEQKHSSVGGSVGAKFQPGLFKTVTLDSPSVSYAAMQATQPEIMAKTGSADTIVVFSPNGGYRLTGMA